MCVKRHSAPSRSKLSAIDVAIEFSFATPTIRPRFPFVDPKIDETNANLFRWHDCWRVTDFKVTAPNQWPTPSRIAPNKRRNLVRCTHRFNPTRRTIDHHRAILIHADSPRLPRDIQSNLEPSDSLPLRKVRISNDIVNKPHACTEFERSIFRHSKESRRCEVCTEIASLLRS